jgi:hypothetical protein
MHMTAKKKAPKKTGEALTREAMAVINKNLANIEAEEQRAAKGAKGKAPATTQPDAVPLAPTVAKGRESRPTAAGKPTAAKNAPKANVGARKTKTVKAPKEKRLSALDAAAQVLASSKEPRNTKSLIAEMEKKGLWKSPGGKTPAATLYAAIIRETGTKKREARFIKTERGLFAFNAKSGK